MDTNQETGVSLQDVADLIEEDQDTDESGENETVDEVAEGDDSETEETAEEGGDESEEIEYEGKAYKVPKEIKDALLRHKDYTVKTQEVAEQRKAVEERANAVQMQERLLSQTFEQRVELASLQKQLAQYEQIDWQGLADSDPVQATKLNLAYQQLQRQAGAKYQELQQAQAQNEQLTQHQRQQMLVQAKTELESRVPGFFTSGKPAELIVNAARHYGISDKELKLISEDAPNAAYMHVLYEAAQWRALQAEKPKAMQKVAEAPKAIKPQAPRPKNPNQAASQRLAKSGRIEDLASFL